MKKMALAIGVLSTFASIGAHAQNSVTLYGLIDAGLTYVNNEGGNSSYKARSGTLNGSRYGLKGNEELGGGLKAIFTLEAGFNIMNGKQSQSGTTFNRQAFVGLSDERFGALTLGRQYDSLVDYVGALEMSSVAHPYDNDNLQNSFRISNSVKYQSVNYGGLKFGALYGFSNSSGGFANNRAYSLGASYNLYGLAIGAGYLQLNNSGSSTNSSGAVSSDYTFQASSQRTWGVGANYVFGPAQVGAIVTQTHLTNLTGISSSASGTSSGLSNNGSGARFNNYELQGKYNFTPALSMTAAYTFTDGKLKGASPKWNQVSLMADYALSKRTDVYLMGVYQHVHGTGNSGITADINGLSASDSNHQTSISVGLRHRF
ncbi:MULTISPECIES: porin [Burkholderia cepacia complex]|uniref:porin n=1 Tax=Burkholderia cepacia complex TaxID=87882 RepID=UPI0009B50379|nr:MULTISPECIES: porin [Burkholderia cepacia complex]